MIVHEIFCHTNIARFAADMKVKQLPDDFRVEELSDQAPSEGPFALYRLDKVNWTTPDALSAIRRRWRIEVRRLSYGGLKDRHASTSQFFTIFRGPQRKMSHQGFEVEYLGQVPEPFDSNHIRANRFHLVVRSLPRDAERHIAQAIAEVAVTGLPNYFDDQRFGSVMGHGKFLARELVQGNFEEGLKLALAAPYPHDRSAIKKEKQVLRQHWGDWPKLKELLERGHARSLVDYLVHHPSDFRGALERLRPELRGLYLSAYQSHLWNQILSRWLKDRLPAQRLTSFDLLLGPMATPRDLTPEEKASFLNLELPLASSKSILAAEDPFKASFDAVLAEEGVTVEQFRLKGFREMFFSRGARPIWCEPRELTSSFGDDELNKGRMKLNLSFELTRGCYATLVIKRVSHEK